MSVYTLGKARKIVKSSKDDSGKRWTTGTLARDRFGDPVDPNSPSATCWCAQGAVIKANGADNHEARADISKLDEAAPRVIGRTVGIVDVNDGIGYDSTVKVFDQAIADTVIEQVPETV